MTPIYMYHLIAIALCGLITTECSKNRCRDHRRIFGWSSDLRRNFRRDHCFSQQDRPRLLRRIGLSKLWLVVGGGGNGVVE